MTNEQTIDEIMKAPARETWQYGVKTDWYTLDQVTAALAAKDAAMAVIEAEAAAMSDALKRIAEAMGLGVGHTAAEIVAALAAKDSEAAQMREAVVAACMDARPIGGRAWSSEQQSCFDALTHVADHIRALPLPTGSQPAEPAPGEWVEWQGGECPIADDVQHEIRTRDGWTSTVGTDASGWDWALQGGDIAIVAYRVLA